jgi:hypothetical protein
VNMRQAARAEAEIRLQAQSLGSLRRARRRQAYAARRAAYAGALHQEGTAAEQLVEVPAMGAKNPPNLSNLEDANPIGTQIPIHVPGHPLSTLYTFSFQCSRMHVCLPMQSLSNELACRMWAMSGTSITMHPLIVKSEILTSSTFDADHRQCRNSMATRPCHQRCGSRGQLGAPPSIISLYFSEVCLLCKCIRIFLESLGMQSGRGQPQFFQVCML